MTTTPVVRQSHFLPDLSEWFDVLMPTPWRQAPYWHGIRIEDLEEDGRYVIRAEMPGIDPDKDVEITVGDGMLNLRAERSERAGDKRRSEFRYGSFTRTVRLPVGAKEADITATYSDGILTITVPIQEEKKAVHKIEVTRK
jgi:HSP20 family molecular chaperone IbpA